MPSQCALTGRHAITGNNVSHSNRKTRRVFKANLHKRRVWNEKTGLYETFTLSRKGIKTLDKIGLEAAKALMQLIKNKTIKNKNKK